MVKKPAPKPTRARASSEDPVNRSGLALALKSTSPAPIKVYSRLSLLCLKSVDTLSQQWCGDLHFEFLFSFPKPAAAASAAERDMAEILEEFFKDSSADEEVTSSSPFKAIFWPKLCHTEDPNPAQEVWIRKARGDVKDRLLRLNRQSQEDYTVVSFSMRCCAPIYQRFQLGLFPFDVQLLRTRIVLAQDSAAWVFAPSAESETLFTACEGGTGGVIIAVNGASSPVLGEWDLISNGVNVACLSSQRASRTRKQYSLLKSFFLIQRHSSYHLVHVFLPGLVILVLAVLTFRLDGQDPGADRSDRSNALVALIFSALGLKATVAQLLPRLGNSTLVDIYVFFVLLYVSFILCLVYTFKHSVQVTDYPLLHSMCGAPTDSSDARHFLDDCQERYCWVLLASGLLLFVVRVWSADAFYHASAQLFSGEADGSPYVPDNLELDEPHGDVWPEAASFLGRTHKRFGRKQRAVFQCCKTVCWLCCCCQK